MTERDKILKTLRAIPGVKEESRQMDFTSFYNPETSNSVAVWKDGVIDSLHTTKATTLAEAVAALTPPAETVNESRDSILKSLSKTKAPEYTPPGAIASFHRPGTFIHVHSSGRIDITIPAETTQS